MSVEHEIAAPVLLARIAAVSSWQAPLHGNDPPRWLAALVGLWREGMALYIRAGMHRAHWGAFW